ncbi:MAG: hypothetical protein HRU19_31815 [Pseudobacteriovorax sp.]|nr:hypothetical protein [Pseudobacteriovorax sp.]
MAGGRQEVPSGYEIYETPYAQVFLTKIKSRRITDLEKFYLQKSVPRISKLRYFLLDTKKDSITLYTPHQDVSYLDELVERGVKDISNFVTYGCDLRFLLVDSSNRMFQLQLHIHRPAVDNWWGIGQPARLSTLMEKYGPHFDDDSFYDMDHPVID